MKPDFYKAVQEGSLNGIEKERISTTQLTPNKNTLLHVAAQFNSGECASEILKINRSLLKEVNSDRETALHVAARNCKGDVAEVIMEFAKGLDRDHGGKGELKWLLESKNIHGDTALHEAIRNNHPSMVKSMIEKDPEIANIANNAMETPLFLAVDKNLPTCMDYIMKYCPSPAYSGPEGRTALHAVALYNRKGISKKLLEKHLTTMKEVDDFGWSPLHYAALRGSNEVAEELLEADRSNEISYEISYIVAEKDNDKTALHIATRVGNVNIMKKILAYCPDCWEMVTSDGRNILHLSVKFEQKEAFNFIMKQSWVGNLVNQKDVQGNTPLHVYAETSHFKGVDLVNHPQVDKNAVNKKNMTPLDVLHCFDNSLSSAWDDLKDKGARPYAWNRQMSGKSRSVAWNRQMSDKSLKKNEERNNQRAKHLEKIGETLVVVAALITTVTFAAGFTIPGGYDGNDGPNKGLAILSRKAAFKAFIITDTLAMICSASAVFIQFIAIFNPAHTGRAAMFTTLAAMLVVVAMWAMVIAFMTGLYTVLEHSLGLAITECVISSFCFLVFCCYFVIIFSEADL